MFLKSFVPLSLASFRLDILIIDYFLETHKPSKDKRKRHLKTEPGFETLTVDENRSKRVPHFPVSHCRQPVRLHSGFPFMGRCPSIRQDISQRIVKSFRPQE